MRRFLTKKYLVLAVILLAVFGFGWARSKSKSDNNKNIKLVAVERKDVVATLTLSGKIKAETEAKLRFMGAGKLGYVKVKDGDRIRRGQVLMGLDWRDLVAAETSAYYSYLAADANAKEVEDGVKGHDRDESLSQKNDRVAAQTARDKAYEMWQTAIRAKQNAHLVSPIDGVVVKVTGSVAGETMGVVDGVDVVDLASLYFDTEVDEGDVGKISEGMGVKVKLDAYPDEELVGQIEKIGFETKISDTGATVVPVKIIIQDSKFAVWDLRLGLNGDAMVVTGEVKNVISLPIEAVVDGKVEKKNGERVSVETGLAGDSDVEIKSGLKEGEWIRLSL